MASPLNTLKGKLKYAGEKLPYGIGTDAKTSFTVAGFKLYPTSLSVSNGGEMKEIKGPIGQVISLIVTEQNYELSGEGYLTSADGNMNFSSINKGDPVTMPTGLPITIPDSTTLRLESISGNFANEDVAKVSFTLKTYPAIS